MHTWQYIVGTSIRDACEGSAFVDLESADQYVADNDPEGIFGYHVYRVRVTFDLGSARMESDLDLPMKAEQTIGLLRA